MQYFGILSMMSPVFKFHLSVRQPRGERRGVKPEKIGQCRVWGPVWSGGQWASGPPERERVVRHSRLGQQTGDQSRRTLPTINTHQHRDLNGLCRALFISRDSAIMAL